MSGEGRRGRTARPSAGGDPWWARTGVVLGVFALSFLFLHSSILTQPPVWDASFSVFPAAQTLVETGYDYPSLTGRPGYLDTGPNVHSLSPVTLVTAVALDALGEGSAMLVALHLVHLAIAAAAGAGVFRIARTALQPAPALSAAVAAMALPVVLTQAGFLYLEMPLLAATAWALAAWLADRRLVALGLVVLAVAIKQPGLAVGAALAIATFLGPGSHRRLAWAAGYASVPLAVAAVILEITGDAVPRLDPSLGVLGTGAANSLAFLRLMPDVMIVIVAYALLRLLRDRGKHGTAGTHAGGADRLSLVAGALVLAFFAFHAASVGVGFVVLPRYWVQLLPIVVVAGFGELRRFVGAATVATAGVGFAIISLVNQAGVLYPQPDCADFVCYERSAEYLPFVANQLDAAEAVAALPESVPVVVNRGTAYRLTYTANTYVAKRIGALITVNERPPAAASDLDGYPDEFYIVSDGLGDGAAEIERLLEAARAEGSVVSEQVFERPPARTTIGHVVRTP